jgi:hypothetical protein
MPRPIASAARAPNRIQWAKEEPSPLNFQVVALEREQFESLFALDDATLRARGIERRVDDEGGSPCRVSLSETAPGEIVYLLNHLHHDVASPYRATGPIFVREQVATARPKPNELPEMLERRLLSLRAYDAQAMLVTSEVVEGKRLREAIQAMFAVSEVSYLHIHNARPGCFNCAVHRAP